MHSTPTSSSATLAPGRAAAARQPAPRRRVVDAPTRMFHWLFALSFLGAYITAEGERWRALHVTLGYTLAGLLVFRVLYGLLGPRHARLGPLLRKLAGATTWLRSAAGALRSGTVQGVAWRQGQNLLMATAVVALLLLAVPLAISGYGTYNDWGDASGGVLGGDWLEEVHETVANAMLAAVLLHVGLIAALSVLRRKNQALPMLTGHVEGPGPHLVKRNHAWLAALLLLAVVAFFAWSWQASPRGLVPATGWAQSAPDGRHHDEDDD